MRFNIFNEKEKITKKNLNKRVMNDFFEVSEVTEEELELQLVALLPAEKTALRRVWCKDYKGSEVPRMLLSDDFTHLTQLNFNGSKHITFLPEEISRLSRLKKLYCENTGVETLPRSLNTMTRLQSLFFLGSELRTLPPMTKLKHVVDLWLSENPLPPHLCKVRKEERGRKEKGRNSANFGNCDFEMMFNCRALGIAKASGFVLVMLSCFTLSMVLFW